MGIDVGTSGCKAVVFSHGGKILSSAYREYGFLSPEPGWGQLESLEVWGRIKEAIAEAAAKCDDPVSALAVTSLGESMVPVTADRRILGDSLLLFDPRGDEYLEDLGSRLDDETLYRITGNTLGSPYSLSKLMWIKQHWKQVYEEADVFLFWSGFVAFMLGAEPAADYSLANRSLLFDVDRTEWSDRLLSWSGLEREKLPRTVPSGTVIGRVSRQASDELGLPEGAAICAGAHDQCGNALGSGVTEEGSAMFGMGTYLCIVPVFARRPDASVMIERGLNTEHHARADRFVSFIYNQCGSVVKWYRDTFAAEEHRQAREAGRDVYDRLFGELPEEPSSVVVLPHFAFMGPPEFISDASGVIAGLRLDTSRGEVLKGILEGSIFSLKESVSTLPGAGIRPKQYRAVGGGSRSEAWVQLCADVLDCGFDRTDVTEAGALGAAILAGAGTGVYSSLEEGTERTVRIRDRFEPNPAKVSRYEEAYRRYLRLWSLLEGFLRGKRSARPGDA
jgi:xylulokinase